MKHRNILMRDPGTKTEDVNETEDTGAGASEEGAGDEKPAEGNGE